MHFLFLAFLALTLACAPIKISLLGRILGLMTGAWCWVYGTAIVYGKPPVGIGALRSFVNLDLSTTAGETATAVLALALTALAAISYRGSAQRLSIAKLNLRFPRWFTYSILLFALFSSVYVVATLGVQTLVSYSGYGSIKALQDVYQGNIIGRLVATGFRLVILLLIVIAITSYKHKRAGYFFLALPAIIIAFLIGIAEASRIVSVYWGVVAVSLIMVGRRDLALGAGLLAFVSVVYAIEARAHTTLGLAYVPEYLIGAFRSNDVVEGALTNVSTGLLVTSGSIRAGNPDSYGEAFKVLSFMPTIDALDNFQIIKASYEQRMLSYLPFNAFGEAWLFGPGYFLAFWAILAVSVLCVNSSMRYGTLPFLALLCLFCFGWAFASQYPIRNCLRIFYFVIVARMAMPYVHNWWQHRRNVAANRRPNNFASRSSRQA